jgi:hypothetical protein
MSEGMVRLNLNSGYSQQSPSTDLTQQKSVVFAQKETVSKWFGSSTVQYLGQAESVQDLSVHAALNLVNGWTWRELRGVMKYR